MRSPCWDQTGISSSLVFWVSCLRSEPSARVVKISVWPSVSPSKRATKASLRPSGDQASPNSSRSVLARADSSVSSAQSSDPVGAEDVDVPPVLGLAEEGDPVAFGGPYGAVVGAVGEPDAVDAVGVAEEQAVGVVLGEDEPLAVGRPVADAFAFGGEGEAGCAGVGDGGHIDVVFAGGGRHIGDAGSVRGPDGGLFRVDVGGQQGGFAGFGVVQHQSGGGRAGVDPGQHPVFRGPAGESGGAGGGGHPAWRRSCRT